MAFDNARSFRVSCRLFVAFLGACLLPARLVNAHEGPPIPVVMDHIMPHYTLSLWADPDIGDATFFIVVEQANNSNEPRHETPQVSLWVEPVDGHLPRVTCDAEPMTLRNQVQFVARPYFHQRDMWRVGITLRCQAGIDEYETQIESTPPGFGAWDLIIYSFPFALLGGMWIIAVVRRVRLITKHSRQTAAQLSNASSHDREKDYDV